VIKTKIDFKKMKKGYKILLIAVIIFLILFSTLYTFLIINNRNLMIVLSRSLPDVEDIEISAKMNAWELTGEQIVMQKYPKMNNAIETADTHKIKETFNEIDFLEKDFWNYKEEYWRLNIIKGIKEIESKEFYILHIPGSPIIKKVNGIYLIVISKEEVSKSEMNKLEKEVEELEKK